MKDESFFDETEQTVRDSGKDHRGTCPRCHMLVARYAPQVVTANEIHHRE